MLRAAHVWLVMGAVAVGVPAASAQTFEAGVKGGLAITGLPYAGMVIDPIVGAASSESLSKVGIEAGGFVRFPLSERWGFQPEAQFVMRGADLHQAAGPDGTANVRLYYFDVPLLARWRTATIPTDPTMFGYVLIGPSFGIKMGNSAELDVPGNTRDLNVDSAFKTLDLGAVLAAGIERGNYLVETRVTAGLTDIATANYAHSHSLHNWTISFLFGMKLR